MKKMLMLLLSAYLLVAGTAAAQTNAQPVLFDSSPVNEITLQTTTSTQSISSPIDTSGYNALVIEYKVTMGCASASYTILYKNSAGTYVGLNSANGYVEIGPANAEVRGGSYTVSPLMGVIYIQLDGLADSNQTCNVTFRYKLAAYSTAMQVTGHIPDVSHQWYPIIIGGKDSTGYNVEAVRVIGGKLQVTGSGDGTVMAPKPPTTVAVSTTAVSVAVSARACVSLSCNVDAYFESGETGGPLATTGSNDIWARSLRSFCFPNTSATNYVSFVTGTGSGTCKVSEHLAPY